MLYQTLRLPARWIHPRGSLPYAYLKELTIVPTAPVPSASCAAVPSKPAPITGVKDTFPNAWKKILWLCGSYKLEKQYVQHTLKCSPNWARAYLLWPTRMQSQWNHSRLVLVPLPREHTLLFSDSSTCGCGRVLLMTWLWVSMRSKSSPEAVMKKDSISTSAHRCSGEKPHASKDFRERFFDEKRRQRLTPD